MLARFERHRQAAIKNSLFRRLTCRALAIENKLFGKKISRDELARNNSDRQITRKTRSHFDPQIMTSRLRTTASRTIRKRLSLFPSSNLSQTIRTIFKVRRTSVTRFVSKKVAQCFKSGQICSSFGPLQHLY